MEMPYLDFCKELQVDGVPGNASWRGWDKDRLESTTHVTHGLQRASTSGSYVVVSAQRHSMCALLRLNLKAGSSHVGQAE